ncbi:MAG: aromatic ring-hydroxylating dioxygenase subunit alpha [Actinomycetota bacterium]
MATGTDPVVGSAYGRGRPEPDNELTRVGPGTPMGELLRRAWQPVGLTPEPGSPPQAIRILGEDLVLYCDGSGRPGLVEPRCAHRGTTLYYGKVTDDGISCCYHGWTFATADGRCIDAPMEPPATLANIRRTVVQPWYPCVDYHGLTFAWMGPPEARPPFPTWDVLEAPSDDPDRPDAILADASGYGLGGGTVLGCNWLQVFENVMDPYHVFVLHSTFSVQQFSDAMAVLPSVEWASTDTGVLTYQDRTLEDGSTYRRITECFLPNARIVPNVGAGTPGEGYRSGGALGFVVPIDDTTTTMFSLLRCRTDDDGVAVFPPRATWGGRSWDELTEAEHQAMPGDHEAQVGQGTITIHATEHLGHTDRGVQMVRRRLREQLRALAAGEPLGGLASGLDTVTSVAGNALHPPGRLPEPPGSF